MKKIAIPILVSFAAIAVVIGLIMLIINYLPLGSAAVISSLFTLAGTLLFAAALIFQSKEYKIQVEELKKAVEAQQKSSKALDEQKNLLIEQNANTLIFKMIDSFNEFKKGESIQQSINSFYTNGKSKFHEIYLQIKNEEKTQEEFHRELAIGIKQSFTDLVKTLNSNFLKKYIQFAYNIFYVIDQNNLPDRRDWFRPFIHIHLSNEEYVILYLSSLVDHEMPYYNGLKWNHNLTLKLIEMINPLTPDSELNDIILNKELHNLMQSKNAQTKD